MSVSRTRGELVIVRALVINVSRDIASTTGSKTEEGYVIYREDELGISNEGGGSLSHFCQARCYSWMSRYATLPV